MALETATYIGDLVPTNPVSGDVVSQGDDHLRLIKNVLLNTFPGLTGPQDLSGFYQPGGPVVAIEDGGTGASTIEAARDNLGVLANTTDTLTGDLTVTGEIILGDVAALSARISMSGGGMLIENSNVGGIDSQLYLSPDGLFLGTTKNDPQVYATGGKDVAIADGGTAASTAAQARVNLGVMANNGDSVTGTYVFSNTDIFPVAVNRIGSSGHMVQFQHNGTVIGAVRDDISGVSYLDLSDREAKQNIRAAGRAGAVAALKAGSPVEFEFKAQSGVKRLGFVAQDMYGVHPEAVAPGDGETPWMMDNSKLVPVLWAALQDALERIEVLEAQMT